jgi:hypothetical protein
MSPRPDYVIDRSRTRSLVLMPRVAIVIREPFDWRLRLAVVCFGLGVVVGVLQLIL